VGLWRGLISRRPKPGLSVVVGCFAVGLMMNGFLVRWWDVCVDDVWASGVD